MKFRDTKFVKNIFNKKSKYDNAVLSSSNDEELIMSMHVDNIEDNKVDSLITPKNNRILDVKNLEVDFQMKNGFFKAVKGVSFNIDKGEIVGLVGESGSGKSTVGKTLMALNSFSKGEINIDGMQLPNNHENLESKQRKFIIKNIQYIFQDPAGALNPNKSIYKALKDVYNDNFKHKMYVFNLHAEIFDSFFGKEEYLKMFNINEDIKYEEINFNYEFRLKSEDEKINDEFFNRLSSSYIDFRTSKWDLSYKQRKKIMTDKEFLSELKKLKSDFNAIKKELEEEASRKMSIIEANDSKKINKVWDKITAVRNKCISKMVKGTFNANSFYKIINSFNGESKYFIKHIDKIIYKQEKINIIEQKDLLRKKIEEIIKKISFSNELLDKKPDSLSGGQQQRAVIAKAIMVNPKLLIADEPIAALDVSIQAQIINTFKKIRSDLGLSILFIAHDLNVVRNISDRIIIMYRGEFLEEGLSNEIFTNPIHPYTRNLLKAIPDLFDSRLYEDLSFKFDKEGKREWTNITPTHKVYSTKEELTKWKVGK